MNNMCKVAVSLALAASAFSANAGTYELKLNESGFANLQQNFNKKDLADLPGGVFADYYTFSFTSLSDLNADIAKLGFSNKVNLDITGFNLISGSTTIGGTAEGGKTDLWSISLNNLAPGSYAFEVLGKVTGVNGGHYHGGVTLSAVSPVPEPETYAMMLAGLGIMGFVARRRKKDATAV